MDHLLLLLLLLWSSGVQAEEKQYLADYLRLVGGAGRCAGTLEIKLGDWRQVDDSGWTLKEAAVVCEHLDCGSAVSVEQRPFSSFRPVWKIRSDCVKSGSDLRECAESTYSNILLNITCSDSVRLVDGTSLCSGRLEVKSNQYNQYDPGWSSVCEADFDQQDAEVVCRQLGCGPLSVLQGALYGEVEAPVWTREFQCGGDESGLLDCRSSGSVRNTCSPGRAVGLTCSDLLRLVGGAGRCAGTLEVKLGDWRPVDGNGWTLKEAAVVCEHLDCGSAVSVERERMSLYPSVWTISTDCVQSRSDLRECAQSANSYTILNITCSDSVRLMDGTSLCSGRLEVNQYNQSWSSVCEADFDQQDAEVVCRQLGCGPPSVLQGALYGEVEAPVWTREFQCGGDESGLLDCRSSGSVRNTCSPGRAVGLTCSEPLRLVGGAGRCAGLLEVKLGNWRPVDGNGWTLKEAPVVCEHLDCGSAVSVEKRWFSSSTSVWKISTDCVQSGSDLRECAESTNSETILNITCSDSVRLVNGTSLCSGRLEVKSNQYNQYDPGWSSVCEADFDQQDAEVVCRQLGCGPLSVLQGALYGEVEAPVWTREFQCGGDESGLLDCRSSGSVRNTCSPGRAVGLTCSDPLRLVGGAGRCAGSLEVKLADWRPVQVYGWTLKEAAVVCEHLDCGSAVAVEYNWFSPFRSAWFFRSDCVQSGSALRECAQSTNSENLLDITCSGVQAEEKQYFTDYLRLVGGAGRCAGTLEVKLGDWRPVDGNGWTPKEAAVVCEHLDCISTVSVDHRQLSSSRSVLSVRSDCVQSGSDLRECAESSESNIILKITCSDSVRLVDGTSLCSGRLEVKSNQSNLYNQSWSSVCEADFDQQDAEVVCRELGCGPPSVLQGALYGEVEAPVWTREFQCGGDESGLLDCRSSGSVRNTCSPGRAVGLTCSDPLRLVGGASRCAGLLEVKLGDWRPVDGNGWTLKEAAVVCEHLDCGSAVSVEKSWFSLSRSAWLFRSDCVQSGSDLRECAESTNSETILNITCSDSVRLVDGTSLCSGRLEVKSNQSNQYNQSWSSVCEADFDQQDAEVVCRELGCGPPSVLQGALYGEVEAPVWTREFQCGGDESGLLDCRSSGSVRNTCSPGRAVGLTCSEPLRLVEGASRCAGLLEMKKEDWKPLQVYGWTLKEAAVVCEHLDCGSALSVEQRWFSSSRPAWRFKSECVPSGSDLRDCTESTYSKAILNITCSDLLVQPIISVTSTNGVSGSEQQGFQVSRGSTFTINCSIQPQYPGGLFQLSFTSSDTTINYTQPAVNHSAHFLFTAAEPAYQENYSCVYQVSVFGHEFSSESRLLSLTVSDPPDIKVLLIRYMVLLLTLLLVVVALCYYYQTTRRQKLSRKKVSFQVHDDGGVYAAVEEGAQEVETSL